MESKNYFAYSCGWFLYQGENNINLLHSKLNYSIASTFDCETELKEMGILERPNLIGGMCLIETNLNEEEIENRLKEKMNEFIKEIKAEGKINV